MHPIKLLAKATAKTLSINGAGGGGKALFNSIDAAHALAGLNPMRSSFAYWRYCGDDTQYSKVKGNLIVKAMRVAREHGFKIKNSTISGLAEAALYQLAQPMCAECNGQPYKRDGDDLAVCTKCAGTGKKQLSTRQVGEVANVSHKAITTNHRIILTELALTIKTWESDVISHVREKMD